ncbi:probable enoyl-CoA hydratase, mitochondrial [Athalia rosae]|uniref:probable enoyl-CoA hydratase, mitochondrial n=1 Tax=Athalia rosae TaxID=37344 RepID=UPI0006269B7E|nr:probable enoyl-CoA hydratase, mitochondrial [Athalia rosae]
MSIANAGRVLFGRTPKLTRNLAQISSLKFYSSQMPKYEFVKTEKVGENQNIAVITLDRMKGLNLLNNTVINEVNDAVFKFDKDDSVSVLILTGSEKAFAAGADVKDMQVMDYSQAVKEEFLESWTAISKTRKPLIGAVNGYALGGGCELALMCDIIYAGEKAQFAQPEITIGTMPGAGGTQRLTRNMGLSKAMEMVLTGNYMNAVEAEKAGLVSKIFPPDQLLAETIKLAEKIASHSPLIISMAKKSVHIAYETTLKQGLQFERTSFYGTFATADRKEGMTAFVEKRAPKYINE